MIYSFNVLLSKQVHLDANRLHFWNTIKSKKLLWAFSRLVILYFLVAIAATFFHNGLIERADWPELGLIGVITALAVFVICYMISYLTLPGRCERLFEQQKLLHEPATITIGDSRINVKTDLVDTSVPYELAHKWIENSTLFLIYHTDNSFQIIPKSDAPTEAIDMLREGLKANNVSGRSL